jgi:uncharacterized protein
MPRITHFEIPVEDTDRAEKFYNGVFGWQFTKWDAGEAGSYWLIQTGEEGTPGINGGMMARKHPDQPVTNVIDVPSVDEYCDRVTAAGGQIVVPKMAVPGVGWLAYFKDLDGNITGMMQNDPSAK